MSDFPFDPRGFYHFDMAHGAVRTREGARVMMLSDAAVATLVSSAVRAGDLTSVRTLGKTLGEHARASLDNSPRSMSPMAVLEHAVSVLALFGWGRLQVERWQYALVIVIDDVPDLEEGTLSLAALLGGMFSALAETDVACVPVEEGRYLVVGPHVAEEVWTWAAEGAELGQIVQALVPGETR